MKQKVFDLLKNEVSTQYGDMSGLASIDGHDPIYLNKLCSEHDIDLEKWFLVGLEFHDGETIGKYPIMVTACLINKKYKDEGFDDISKRLPLISKVEIHKKTFEISYSDLGKYIKRLSIGVLSPLSEYMNEAEFVDDEDE